MQTLNVAYSTIVTVLGTIPSFVVPQGDGGYEIFAVGSDSVIQCRLAGDDANIADFESTYLANCVSVASGDDALVLGSKTNNVPLVQPRNYDGRPIFQPVTLGSGQWHYWHGQGDDVTSDPPVLGGGQAFEASLATAGDLPVTWIYRDPVWIAGGTLKYQGAQIGDHVSFVIYAPATEITPSDGGNTGNCHLVYGVLIPAAGNGAWNVDLETAVPVPTSDFEPYSGYWDYALPNEMRGRGTITPGVPGKAKYHLIPARMDLDRFVSKERLLGTGDSYYEPQNINVSLCLPGWRFECTVHNETGDHTVEVVWRVLVSRYWTTM